MPNENETTYRSADGSIRCIRCIHCDLPRNLCSCYLPGASPSRGAYAEEPDTGPERREWQGGGL